MLEVRALTTKTLSLGAELFVALSGDAQRFHPHPLTAAQAGVIAGMRSRDVYLLAIRAEPQKAAVAYGILRGWDAGFDVPSLGVAVHPDARGVGVGLAMMGVLHCVARMRGAPSVRLKVYPDNTPAVRLYTKLGYQWSDTLEDNQLVGVKRL